MHDFLQAEGQPHDDSHIRRQLAGAAAPPRRAPPKDLLTPPHWFLAKGEGNCITVVRLMIFAAAAASRERRAAFLERPRHVSPLLQLPILITDYFRHCHFTPTLHRYWPLLLPPQRFQINTSQGQCRHNNRQSRQQYFNS